MRSPRTAGRVAGRLSGKAARLAALGAALAASLVACSDDEAPPPPSRFGYQTADQFPRQDCQAGSLAQLAPEGLYHGLATGTGRTISLTARVDAGPGDQLSGKIYSSVVTSAVHTEDDLLVRAESTDSLLAFDWCGRLPSGELVGSYVVCSARGCDVSRLIGNQVVPLAEPAAQNLTLLGGSTSALWGPLPFAVNVRVVDGLAYVARYHSGLSIVDVSNPAAMVHLGELPVETTQGAELYNDVKIYDGAGGKRYALMASNVAGVVVVDVTQPRLPHVVGHFGATAADPTPNVHTIAISGGRAYLANTRTGLDIYDLSQLPQATALGQIGRAHV
jgi:hypothetical protein